MRDFSKETFSLPLPVYPACIPHARLANRPATVHVQVFAALLGMAPGGCLRQALLGGLPERALEGLSGLMPHLLCGEESAALAFTGFRHAGEAGAARALWGGIAADERLHEFMLGHLCQALGADRRPDARRERRRAQLFFMRLKSPDAATHFARIAALDCLVTRVLAALAGRHSLLHAQPAMVRLLGRIRRDEARHVAATRGHVLHTDTGPALLRAERAWVAEAFRAFLAPAYPAFDLLQVDPRILAKCLH